MYVDLVYPKYIICILYCFRARKEWPA